MDGQDNLQARARVGAAGARSWADPGDRRTILIPFRFI